MTTDHWGYEKEQQPDIVEVIRCKYCDHWETAYDADKAEHGLCYGHRFSVFVTPADGYCDKGERRAQWSNISKAEHPDEEACVLYDGKEDYEENDKE